MYVNANSIIINGVSMGTYLTQADFEYNKLWSSDTGRNLAGTNTGTLIGIFPKLVLTFRKLNQTELHTIAPVLDSATQTIQYHDDNAGTTKTMTTYSGDWKAVCKKLGMAEGVQCSFISMRKRS